MSRDSWAVVSGLFVLALGAIAVAGLVRPEAPVKGGSATSAVAAPVATISGPPPSVAPELPGVSPLIGRILESSGDARLAGDEELAQLPPKVAELLIHYGVPLRVAETGERG